MLVLPGSGTFRLFSFHSIRIILSFIFLMTTLSCGSSGLGGSGSVNHLPQYMLKVLHNGTLRATLQVYGPDGALVHEENLQVNQNTGEVFSSQFNLKRGFKYSFIITFFYTGEGLPELPISFVALIQTLGEEFHSLTWDESDIILANEQVSPDISASLLTTGLPNLDEDSDGFSNFFEIREGSSPIDPDSIPHSPVLSSGTISDGQLDQIEFTLVFEDSSGIAEVLPMDPFCGYSTWEVTPLDGEGRQVELHGVFNTHAHTALSNITLQISAKDILGLAETFSFSVSFQKTPTQDPEKLGPEIAFLRPRPNETVSDVIQAEVLACDEHGIKSLRPTLGDFGDGDPSAERYFGEVNTFALGDGAQVLNFVAENLQNRSKTRGIPLMVANGNPIKVDNPAPGSEIKDTLTLIARVDTDLMPDVTDLFVESITSSRFAGGEEDPDFFDLKFDTNQLAEAYKQTLDTAAFEPNERTFTVKFRAVGSSSSLVTREVTYKINNDPDIDFFVNNGDAEASCITGGSLNLKWQVTNRGTNDPIRLNGEDVTSSSGNGSRTISCDDPTTNYKLEAIRKNEIFKAIQEINLTKIGISGLTAGQLVDPDYFSFNLTGANPNTKWKVELWNKGNLEETFEGFGSLVELENIEPRSDFDAVIHILNDAYLTVSKSQPIPITTIHEGLVAWWRFDDPDDIGKDSSGFGNHLFGNNNTLSSNCILESCLALDIFSFYIYANPSNSLNVTQSLTIEGWIKWEGSINGGILEKLNHYGIGVQGSNLEFGVWDNGLKRKIVSVPITSFVTGEWYFIAGVYDLNSKFQEIYVSGGTSVRKEITKEIYNSWGNVYLGSNSSLTIMSGTLDEITIYERALSLSEIKNNCNRLIPDNCI